MVGAAEVLVLGAQCTAVVGAAEVCPRWSHPSVVYDSISPQLPNSLQRNIVFVSQLVFYMKCTVHNVCTYSEVIHQGRVIGVSTLVYRSTADVIYLPPTQLKRQMQQNQHQQICLELNSSRSNPIYLPTKLN